MTDTRHIYKNNCELACEMLLGVMPELKMIKGVYYDSAVNRRFPHWWLEDEAGNITDPTKYQFINHSIKENYIKQEDMVCDYCKKPLGNGKIVVIEKFFLCSMECRYKI